MFVTRVTCAVRQEQYFVKESNVGTACAPLRAAGDSNAPCKHALRQTARRKTSARALCTHSSNSVRLPTSSEYDSDWDSRNADLRLTIREARTPAEYEAVGWLRATAYYEVLLRAPICYNVEVLLYVNIPVRSQLVILQG